MKLKERSIKMVIQQCDVLRNRRWNRGGETKAVIKIVT